MLVVIPTFQRFPGIVISISRDRKYISEVCDTVYELTMECLAQLHDS